MLVSVIVTYRRKGSTNNEELFTSSVVLQHVYEVLLAIVIMVQRRIKA
jgi:hypothetical protein